MPILGVYGNNDPASVQSFEQQLGQNVGIITMFAGPYQSWSDAISTTQWCASLNWDAPLAWTIRPLPQSGGDLGTAAQGGYNSYYKQFAQIIAAKQPTGDIIVRPFHELNGDWYPWAAGGREQTFIEAWKQFVDTFRGVSDRFKFDWNVNQGSAGSVSNPALAYPGDNYVDIVSMDAYYDTRWWGTDPVKAFSTLQNETYGLNWLQSFASAHGKQTAFPEWGVNSDNAGPYIQAFANWMNDPSHNVRYQSYWESNNDFSGTLFGQYPDAAAAYKAAFGGSGGGTATTTASAPAADALAIAATDASKAEGNSGTTPFTFTVTRSGDSSAAASVNWAVTGSGANPANASDFTGGVLPSGTVSFAAGDTSKVISIGVAGDTTVEPDEGFTVTLAGASSGATIATASADGTILNDDSAPTTPTPAASLAIAATDASKAEGNSGTTPFTFTVTRSGDTGIASSANWTVAGSGSSPANASDFAGGALPSGSVSFAAGETSKVISVGVAGDTTVEPDEGFTVTLSGASSGTSIATATASGTILNDDAATAGVTTRTLQLDLSEDAYKGNARFVVAVDGKRLGPAQSVTALHSQGQTEAFQFQVPMAAGTHDVAVTFTNDAWGGVWTQDRNLYVDAISCGSATATGTPDTLFSAGTHHFALNLPT